MKEKPDLNFWKLMESEFRLLWCPDCICFTECKYLAEYLQRLVLIPMT
jgi:hypothetical protein